MTIPGEDYMSAHSTAAAGPSSSQYGSSSADGASGADPSGSSVPPPSSPSLSTFRRHQPASTGEAAEPFPGLTGLRRRHSQQHQQHRPTAGGGGAVAPDTILVDVRSPWSDLASGRPEGWPMNRDKTVAQLKDDCARGDFGEKFEREGLRLVWHGRIVRDNETLGEVVGEVVHTFHLVGKRIPSGLARPGFSRAPTAWAPVAPAPTHAAAAPVEANGASGPNVQPLATESSAIPTAGPVDDATHLALLDATHYLLFTARHHLFCLLALPPLAWDQTVPPPVVPREIARQAVMSVVKLFAEQHGWTGWEKAFELEEQDRHKQAWTDRGRSGVQAEIKDIWLSRVGREWSQGPQGETVAVENDGAEHLLNLPPLERLSASQVLHLLAYLRVTALLPLLAHELELISQAITVRSRPAPSRTTSSPTRLIRAERPRTWAERLAPFAVSWSLFAHIFVSAIKLSGMLWMLTRNMKWTDGRFWFLSAAAAIFLFAEALPRLRLEARRRAAAAGAAAVPGGNAADQAHDALNGIAADAPAHVREAMRAAGLPAGRPPRQHRRGLVASLALLHMDTDSRQLHLPRSSLHSALDPASVQRRATNINDPDRIAAYRRRAGPRPPWIITQLLLPVALWVITLVPALETIRAKAIKKRETSMRVLVGELTAAQAAAEAADAAAATEANTAPLAEGVDGTPVQSPAPSPADAPRPPVLPGGLDDVARKYYARVVARGEGIDWEEELEAQRALGVGGEDDQRQRDGEGMRLPVL